MTSTLLKPADSIAGINLPAVETFCSRYGEAHLLFACHAALPLSLTPELLYSLWVNFPVDCRHQRLDIPWIATADLLLSNLCEEVGSGLYEMERSVRAELLAYLEDNPYFGEKRVQELAVFLGVYVQPQLKSENLEAQDFARTQNWVSIAYLQPEKAARELSNALANTFQKQPDDLLRISSIVGALEKPLSHYPDLLTYARGMSKYAWGDIQAMQAELKEVRPSENLYLPSRPIASLYAPQRLHQRVMEKQQIKYGKLPLVAHILLSISFGVVTVFIFWSLWSGLVDLVKLFNQEQVFEPSNTSEWTIGRTILSFTTDRYSVRIYREAEQTRMNVFDRNFNIARLSGVATAFTIQSGLMTYISLDTFGGQQALYEVDLVDPEQVTLVIREDSGNLITNELATNVRVFDLPDGHYLVRDNTILAFDTETYSVRVFERDQNLFMNAYNKSTRNAEANGQAASIASNETSYEDLVGYVSSADRNGQLIEFLAHVDSLGRTSLEIYTIEGQRIFRESGQEPTIINIPKEHLPLP